MSDPKAKLIALAQLSPKRTIKTGFKPVGTSTIGPDYNSLIADFVLAEWNAGDASTNSPSLARARKSLGLLAASLA